MIPVEALEAALPKILQAGVDAYPREAVGVVCPDATILYFTNEAKGDREYLVSSRQLTHAFMGDGGLYELGWNLSDVVVWHTHPGGLIGPSIGDLRQRRDEGLEDVAHMVVTLPNGECCYY